MTEIMQGLLTDYVNLLAKEHPTAARLVQAYANNELRQNQSTQPVPDADAED